MNKRYVDNDGNFWNGKSIVIGEQRIWNPTEEQLSEAGYTEFVKPEPTAEQLLAQAKSAKLVAIESYDRSEAVNSFTIGGAPMWLTVEEREQIATQINASAAMGRETMTRWFNGVSYTFPLATWQQMLVALEVYAGDALNVTESHKAEVMAMETVAEVEAFDVTIGYPQKLQL